MDSFTSALTVRLLKPYTPRNPATPNPCPTLRRYVGFRGFKPEPSSSPEAFRKAPKSSVSVAGKLKGSWVLDCILGHQTVFSEERLVAVALNGPRPWKLGLQRALLIEKRANMLSVAYFLVLWCRKESV